MTAEITQNQEPENKYNILLKEKGVQKLETFLKIATQRTEEFFTEINPEKNSITFNCMDPSHVSIVTCVLNNDDFDDDFEIQNLDNILQFNLKSSDIFKILTLHEDSQITIVPVLDKNNNFDLLKFMIAQNGIIIKEIFVPISETTNETALENQNRVVTGLLDGVDTLGIKIELSYFVELLKESEIFSNERIRFNVNVKGERVDSLSIETYDQITDKSRKIKTNLYQGLHFARVKLKNNQENFNFNVSFSYTDLKKLAVSSKAYKDLTILLAEKNPIGLLYQTNNNETNTDTIIAVLAPVLIDQNENANPVQEQQEEDDLKAES